MWGGHIGEWGASGRVKEQIFEARLEILGAWIRWVIGNVEEESVLGGGTGFLCPWWFVLVDEAGFKEGDECFGWVAAFSEAAIEFLEVGETIIRAGGQTVDPLYHPIYEAGEDP